MSRVVKLSITLVLAASVGLGHPASNPVAKCGGAKKKAAVKKIAAKLKCIQKADVGGVSVDPTCLMAAENKFTSAIAKADARGGCVRSGDANTIEAAVDSCVN